MTYIEAMEADNLEIGSVPQLIQAGNYSRYELRLIRVWEMIHMRVLHKLNSELRDEERGGRGFPGPNVPGENNPRESSSEDIVQGQSCKLFGQSADPWVFILDAMTHHLAFGQVNTVKGSSSIQTTENENPANAGSLTQNGSAPVKLERRSSSFSEMGRVPEQNASHAPPAYTATAAYPAGYPIAPPPGYRPAQQSKSTMYYPATKHTRNENWVSQPLSFTPVNPGVSHTHTPSLFSDGSRPIAPSTAVTNANTTPNVLPINAPGARHYWNHAYRSRVRDRTPASLTPAAIATIASAAIASANAAPAAPHPTPSAEEPPILRYSCPVPGCTFMTPDLPNVNTRLSMSSHWRGKHRADFGDCRLYFEASGLEFPPGKKNA
ncbi:hypothetical protein K402DRAFT_392644 [Aulographum hederae CBS 113979]|uniref:Uncharacterized protein n=1 Tax=Aulographum hederae CBS 113979 TaxID=1176131 RepID=A0A6G1H4F9_9PEZI|nr:hypothetical protein K402DRAFT_392644 [Aulographum hederae CBS 113979]